MHKDPKQLVLDILTIVNFQGDKEAYSQEFLQLCHEQALVDTLKSFPHEKQHELQRLLGNTTDQERQQAILTAYIQPEEYEQALLHAAVALSQAFIHTLLPGMTTYQEEKLRSYLSSLQL